LQNKADGQNNQRYAADQFAIKHGVSSSYLLADDFDGVVDGSRGDGH
jgi:hypothetical protein